MASISFSKTFVVFCLLFAVGVFFGSACGDDSDPVVVVNSGGGGGDNNDTEIIGDPVPVEIQCDPGLSYCSEQCVNTEENPQHCGSCDEVCGEGELCVLGRCNPPAGTCPENSCTGHTYCDGSTGVCRPGCSSDSQCHGGQTCNVTLFECACPEGQRLCGGKCFDIDDPEACGDCMNCPSPSTGTAQCIQGQCDVLCDDDLLRCGDRCAQCPENASEVGCDGNQCVATACGEDAELCGGECADCPTDALEVGCDGNQCVATACHGSQRSCNGECVDCPTDFVSSTTCDGVQCVADTCDQSQGPREACGGNCVSCPTGGAGYECSGDQCVADCGPGQHLCGDSCVDSTSVDHCGDRCSPCETIAGGAPQCIEDRCQLICDDDKRPCADGCCSFSTAHVTDHSIYAMDTAVDSQGRVHIALRVNGYVHYGAPSGNSWDFEQLPPETSFIWEDPVAITLDGNDRPYIFYFGDGYGRNVMTSYYTGSTWVEEEIDSGGGDHDKISAATDLSGNPLVVYPGGSNWNDGIFMAARDGDNFSIAEVTDRIGFGGGYPSMVVSSNGVPHILYLDNSGSDDRMLTYAYIDFNVMEWREEVVTQLAYAGSAEIAIGANNTLQVLINEDGDFRIAHRVGEDSWQLETIASSSSRWGYDFAVDDQGVPHIAFSEAYDDELHYGHRLYGEWTINRITEAVDIDGQRSMTPHIVMVEGDPYIFYQDSNNEIWVVR